MQRTFFFCNHYNSGSMKLKSSSTLLALFFSLFVCGSTTAKSATSTTDKVTLPDSRIASTDKSLIINGHKFVDLALPSGLLWAETNIGAETKYNTGTFFAWGESANEDKASYSRESYRHSAKDGQMTKYCDKDKKTTLNKSDDAAYTIWGAPCRMPSQEEAMELLNPDNCTWEWTNIEKEGYKVTSKKNGNSIFLAAGGIAIDSGFEDIGFAGFYWTSTLTPLNEGGFGNRYAYQISFDEEHDDPRLTNFERCYGCPVRPVLNYNDYKAQKAAIAASKTQGYKIIDGHKFVDLALPSGLLWAETNIGAKTACDDGKYFAWGETAMDNRAARQWEAYRFGPSQDNLTKYNAADKKTALDKEDDAAQVNWGVSCRMPSDEDFNELLNPTNCKWTWTSMPTAKGTATKGYKVTSVRNGKSIFLPASGNLDGGRIYSRGSDGLYWSRTLGNYGSDAHALMFDKIRIPTQSGLYRHWGCTIRPVAEQ